MSKAGKILLTLAMLCLSLILICLAGYFEARSKYGKRMEEEERKMKALGTAVKQLEEMNKKQQLSPDDWKKASGH